jgi:predicted trehalose synthase
MADESTEEAEATTDATTESAGVAVDLDALAERDAVIDELEETVATQTEQIRELEDLMLDLSTRVAADGATGVCPDCHGPVVKVSPIFRAAKVKCVSCGRVFHEF